MNDYNRTELPHPADILREECGERPCPNTPIGFAANFQFVSTLPVSEVIGGPTDNTLRTEGRATATSLISQADADAKAEASARENARLEMEFLLGTRNPPKGEWIV